MGNKVTQADRDAAHALYKAGGWELLTALPDDDDMVQAFARHRQQAITQHEGERGEPVAWMYEHPNGERDVFKTRRPQYIEESYMGSSEWTETPLYPPATRPAALAEEVARLREALGVIASNPNYPSGFLHGIAYCALNEQPGGEPRP